MCYSDCCIRCNENLSIPIIYEMIPRAIFTVFFVQDDGHERRLASNSLDIAVDNRDESEVKMTIRGSEHDDWNVCACY